MAGKNVTVEDTSPMITYSGKWDCSTGDSKYTRYSADSFHATSDGEANATFTFHGTAVYLYGAKRENHGPFDVTLDGHTERYNGYAEEEHEEFQTLLFSEDELELDTHTITLSNVATPGQGTPWLDLDYLVVTTGGKKGRTVETKMVDDADGDEFLWSQEWVTNDGNNYGYKRTQHRTYTTNAWVNISFSGSAIEVHATVNQSSAPFRASLDDAPYTDFKPNNAKLFVNDTLLYFASGLSSGKHTLALMHSGSSSQFLGMDYLRIHSFPRSPLSAGAIAGTVLGALAFLLIATLVPALYFIRKRQAQRKAEHALEEARPFKLRNTHELDETWTSRAYQDPYVPGYGVGAGHGRDASVETFHARGGSLNSQGSYAYRGGTPYPAHSPAPETPPVSPPVSGKRARHQRPPARNPFGSSSSGGGVGHARAESQEVLLIEPQRSRGHAREESSSAFAAIPRDRPPGYTPNQPELSPPLEPNRRREKRRR